MIRGRILIAALAAMLPCGTAYADLSPGSYYLSKTNPIANVDQRDLEALALQLSARPDVKAACEVAKISWARVTDRLMPSDQMARFPDAMSDYCFKSALVAANTDGNYPRVLRVMLPPHRWFGMDVPGAKWGGDNPDNAYRIIPIAAGGRYEVRGHRQHEPSTYVTFQIVGDSNTSQTLASLEQRDMKLGGDGRYVLTLDGTPPNGRPNHLHIPEGAMYLFIRDSMGDWATQSPDTLEVKRLDPPTRGPLDEGELARTTIRNIRYDLYYQYYAARLFFNGPQMMPAPALAGSVGGLITQQGSLGHFTLKDDEAVVITANGGDAAYRNIVLHDLWLRSLDYRNNLTSFNNAQMAPDADGRFTFVIARQDPGVANWLDTMGLGDVLVLHRWQGFPASGTRQAAAIESKVVKLKHLLSALPAGVRRVSPGERAVQIADRQKAHDRRFVED